MAFFSVDGDCDVNGYCVSSANYPNAHGNDESCSVTILQGVFITPSENFAIETCCDHLIIQGVDIESKEQVPTFLNAGEQFSWTSDYSVAESGWELCFSAPYSIKPTRTPKPLMITLLLK